MLAALCRVLFENTLKITDLASANIQHPSCSRRVHFTQAYPLCCERKKNLVSRFHENWPFFCMHHSPKGVVPFLKILYLLWIIHFLQNTADLQVGAGARFKHWLCYTQAKNNSNLFCKRLKKKQKQTVAVLWLATSKALNQFHIVQQEGTACVVYLNCYKLEFLFPCKASLYWKKLALTISHRLPKIYNPSNRGLIVWFLNIMWIKTNLKACDEILARPCNVLLP